MVTIKKTIQILMVMVTILISTSITIAIPENVEGATGTSSGRLSKWYGNYETSTSYHTINGIVAWCINPELPWPYNQEYIETVSNDVGVYNILYYAIENGYHLNEDDYVDTYVALNWYLGKSTSQAKQNDPTVKYLYNKAKNPDAPIGAFDIQNKTQTASFKEGNNYQETGWYKPVTDGSNIKYTLTVPSGVTLITSDGQTKGSGKHTLNQNQNFKLRASTDYEGTVNLTVNTNVLKKMALIFLPTDPGVQRLATMGKGEDPVSIPNITAKFHKRTGKGTIYKKDKESNKSLSGAEFSVKDLNTGKTKNVTTNSNGQVNWGEALIGHKLEVTEKKAPTNYILNGEKQTITVKSGNDNHLTFKNDRKAELQLSKVQIYTDKATDGLPIKIYTKRVKSSPTADQKQVTVSVYEKESGEKVLSIPYKIGQLPSVINAKIPDNHLEKNQKRNYIVKLEVDDRYAYVTDGYGEINTDGYTASEKQITVQAEDASKVSYKGVVMTERSIKKNMKTYYENFSVPTNKIEKQKTGYGFERKFNTAYTNDLNQSTSFDMKLTVDSDLIDSYLPYSTAGGKSEIRLEKTTTDSDKLQYRLPHVNVEQQTGALFTDKQVSDNDSRIQYDLKDGGHKLYVPIWAELGDYDISVQNTEPIGTNQISFLINDSVNLYAYMFGHYNSDTIEQDEIMIEPVLHEQPFPSEIPDNWGYTKSDGTKALTDEEKDWFDQTLTYQKVKIIFDENGGSGSVSDMNVSVGQEVAIPSHTLSKTNNVFEGWSYGGQVYKTGDIIKPTSNIVLKAVWKNEEATVSYHANGGEKSPESEVVPLGSTYTLSEQIPERSGYDFVGWEHNGKVYQPGSKFSVTTKEISFVAKWTNSEKVVSYNANGGTGEPSNTTAKSNTVYTVSNEIPTRKNYDFKGWEYEGDIYQPGTKVEVTDKNIDFGAIWELKSVMISFNGNGGFNVPNNDQVGAGNDYILPETEPSKELTQFKGWKNNIDGKVYQAGETVTLSDRDVEFVAIWENETQTIAFDYNGGKGSLTTETANTGSEYTVPDSIPTKESHGFIGWEYEGNVYQSGDKITIPEKDITLTAQWEIGRHKVIYDLNGGEGLTEDITIGSNMDFKIEVNEPTKVGHTFNGWKSSSDGKLYQPGDITNVTKDTTLTAQWTVNKYAVSYNLNSGSGNFSSVEQNYNTSFTVSNTKPTRTGYTFTGWKRSDTGAIVQSGAKFNIPANDVTLTAQWTINKYTVSYNLNNGSGNFSSVEQNYNTSFTVSNTKPTRTGYTFTGWKRSDTGAIVQPGSKFNIPANDVTLTAQWKINTYIISYHANGGEGEPSSQTKTYGQALNLSTTKPTRTGYRFDGWNTKSDGTGTSYASGGTYIGNAEVTLYAKWVEQAEYVYKLLDHRPDIISSNYGFGDSPGINLIAGEKYYMETWGSVDQQAKKDGKSLTVYLYPSNWAWATETIVSGNWGHKYFIIPTSDEYRLTGYLYPSGGSRLGKAHWINTTIYQDDANYSGNSIWKSIDKGKSIILPEAKATRAKYTFTGWKNNIDGRVYQPGEKVAITKNTTFTAQWTPKHQVLFNLNGGNGNLDTVNITEGSKFIVPTNQPVRDGYRFNGYKNSVDGKIYYPGDRITITKDTTLTAQWVKQVEYHYYLLKYAQNETSNAYGFGRDSGLNLIAGMPYYLESSGYIDQQAKNDGKVLRVFLYTPSWSYSTSTIHDRTEKQWKSSYFIAPESGEYRIAGYLYPDGGNRSGKAYWDYSNIYQGDFYQPGNINKKVDVGTIITLPEPYATRTGYNFIGWKNHADGKIYQPGDKIKLQADKTFFDAQWR